MAVVPLESYRPPRGQWRTLPESRRESVHGVDVAAEFVAGASEWPADLDRRHFLKLMGASLAFGGLAGCARRAADTIVPYVTPPEDRPATWPDYYATAVPVEGFGRGILVESILGRPTKIEGNPDHPESLGATDAITQAAILSLYDPDRSRTPLHEGRPATWPEFEADWSSRKAALDGVRGRGLALLTEPTTSPSLLREIGLFLAAFPAARWYQHTALAGYEVDGIQPDFDFGKTDIVFAIGSDFLFRHPACLRYSRDFSKRRRSGVAMGRSTRLYAMEATPTLTGALADFRLPASPARVRLLLDELARSLESGWAPAAERFSAGEIQFVASLSKALRAQDLVAVCIAGAEQDADIQRWALAMNERLGRDAGAYARIPSIRSDTDRRASGDLEALAASISQGEVEALCILGPNPAYTAPEPLGFPALLSRVPHTVHLGSHHDETGVACRWHLPEAHFLESWSDLRAYGGGTTILQPLIEPLYEGRGGLEVLRMLWRQGAGSAYEIVRETWQADAGGAEFETRWSSWLNRGWVEGAPVKPALSHSMNPVPALEPQDQPRGRVLVLEPDSTVLDGRWANNAWLQELPKPLSHLVWDNAATVSPALAAELGIETGDFLLLSCGSLSLKAAAWIMPGQAADCVGLSLGYGRTHAGAVGDGRGFNAYRLRSKTSAWIVPALQVTKAGGAFPLVSTQHHFEMAGREPVQVVWEGELQAKASAEAGSLYPPWPPGAHAWGMSIDLNACTGCNACVIACQAENNIPVVGKDQVSRGREMHWIRIDRYFEGPPANPLVLHQPVPCMHCENAPCELVCPVAATVHSSEGLNQMVYNRCVGTRYCSNNCPYKVRRFNFLDYRTGRDSPIDLQKNPDVTVRNRGVMEKCTYCVQRINAARIAAARDNRPIRDGEIRTACEQACPAEAIVFGDISDPGSRVARLKAGPRSYSLLGGLNTRPRTTYLARVRADEKGLPA
jgi:Fe-S-cluster-containing dehydrogenase component/anaerobic selenocysteine-containing dehydrogenase